MNLMYGIVYLVGGVVLWATVGALNMWLRWSYLTRRKVQESTIAVQQLLREKAVQGGTAPSPLITSEEEMQEFYDYDRKQ